ncbi:MAG: hypothetical protein WD845_10430, partial [Pirellulales bacterium]
MSVAWCALRSMCTSAASVLSMHAAIDSLSQAAAGGARRCELGQLLVQLNQQVVAATAQLPCELTEVPRPGGAAEQLDG